MCTKDKPYTMLDAYPHFKDYLSDDEMLELHDYDACTRSSLQKLLPGWTVEGDACEMCVSKEFPTETGLMPFKVYVHTYIKMLGIEGAAKEYQRIYDNILECFYEFKHHWHRSHGSDPMPEVVPSEFRRWMMA